MVVPIPDVLGLTCEGIIVDAETTAETSDICASLQYAEALCCPSAASTCSICKGTKLFADVEVVDENGATWTCGQLAYDAARYEPTSADCASHHDYEEFCCPDVYISTPSTSSPTSSVSRYVFTFLYVSGIVLLFISAKCNLRCIATYLTSFVHKWGTLSSM